MRAHIGFEPYRAFARDSGAGLRHQMPPVRYTFRDDRAVLSRHQYNGVAGKADRLGKDFDLVDRLGLHLAEIGVEAEIAAHDHRARPPLDEADQFEACRDEGEGRMRSECALARDRIIGFRRGGEPGAGFCSQGLLLAPRPADIAREGSEAIGVEAEIAAETRGRAAPGRE